MEDIVVVEDDSVIKKINKTAEKLTKKFSKKRKLDEAQLLKSRPLWQKILIGCVDTLLVFLIVFSCCLSISVLVAKKDKTVPSFAGFSALTIASGSMVDAGFDIGDTIVTQAVDTRTLNAGDKIAFYVYAKDYNRFYSLKSSVVETQQKTKGKFSFASFFGVKSQKITEASRAGANLVFHEIVKVYEDQNGERWFKTKGASNSSEDTWVTSENMVLGVLVENGFSHFLASILTLLTKKMVMLILAIVLPLVALIGMMAFELMRYISLVKIELDVVEEKRKLTDDICVKNKIGFGMDKKTKLKVLAQATPEEKAEYISLLWEDGQAPNSIKKYYLRQQQMLKFNKKLLSLNRECEQMFKDGVSANKIAKHYLKEKEKIEEERKNTQERLNEIRKAYKETKGTDADVAVAE